MEHFLYSFLPLLLTVVGIIISVRALTKNQAKLNLPPGPWRLPIVGNLHQLIGSLPHQRMRDLSRTYGPLMHLQMGEVPMVVASSAEAAKEIMKTHDVNFAYRPKVSSFNVMTYQGKSLTTAPYGEYYRQLRKVSTVELLSAKRVLSLWSMQEEEVHSLIESIYSISSQSKVINLSEMLTPTVNNIAATAAIGGKYRDQAIFLELMHEFLQLAAGFGLADLFPSLTRLLGFFIRSKSKAEVLHQKLDEILEGVIQEHKLHKAKGTGSTEQAKEGFVDVLLRLQACGGLPFDLTTDCIKAVTLDMFIGGSETASTVLLWAMSELMKNPRVMKRAQSEIQQILRDKTSITETDIGELSYLQLVIKETLRLHIPAPLLSPRECRQTCEIFGYTIPEKTRVVVNVWAIGRDPNYWEDAEVFIPERFEGSTIDFKGANFEFLPFGAGRRMCPGLLFGIATVELVLAQLLYHFDWKLPDPLSGKTSLVRPRKQVSGLDPKDLDMSEAFGITTGRNTDLCLHAISRT